MASKIRLPRVNQLLLEEIAAIIQHELSDPAIGFITVVDVKTSPDLTHAIVHVSSLAAAEERPRAIEALNHAAIFIRRTLIPRLNLKTVPRLAFRLDETAERAVRISALLREAAAGPRPAPEGDEE